MTSWNQKKAGSIVDAIGIFLDDVQDSNARAKLCAIRQQAVDAERSPQTGNTEVSDLERALCSLCHGEAVFNALATIAGKAAIS